MKTEHDFFPDLFIPPDGLIRTPPPDRMKEYAAKTKSIGSFSKTLLRP
jgi:hypothetical protein